MRLSTDEDRDEARAFETVGTASVAGITVFDTAHAYGRGQEERGHNERLLARALRAVRAESRARIVTKGGMARPEGAWVPDGRAKAIRADCEASLEALGGLPIDLYLLHAPDPSTPWVTSLRALGRLVDEGLVRRVGVSNVNRRKLDEALQVVPIAAVQVAVSPFDDRAIRGGVVERCAELGVAVMAHSPLGGPRRADRLAREPVLRQVSEARDATPAEVVLAWIGGLAPGLIPVPGARRPETARSAARAAALVLDEADHRALTSSFLGSRSTPRSRSRPPGGGDVVLVMGIPGAGKSRVAEEYVSRGYVRFNRDQRGGSLRDLADALDRELSAGVRRVVLDNTYLSRATRSHPIEVADRHGASVRCIWLDTPLAHAQVNMVERLLDRFGALPDPEEVRAAARREPWLLMPTSQMRAVRELEPPSPDEGLATVERVAFVRSPPAAEGRPALLVAAAALGRPGWWRALPERGGSDAGLVFDWRPGAGADALEDERARLAADVSGSVEAAVCPHGAGPPRCWCRPPLPGLPLAFARHHGVDLSRSVLVGVGPAHRTLATTLGSTYVEA
jgi:aryl-alcohol dehydrogenase-like predicted oxidoreductase/predicted kinase